MTLLVELNSIVESIENGTFDGNGKCYASSREGMREWLHNKRVVEKLLKVAEVFCGGPDLLTQYFVEQQMTDNEIDGIIAPHKNRIEGIMQKYKFSFTSSNFFFICGSRFLQHQPKQKFEIQRSFG